MGYTPEDQEIKRQAQKMGLSLTGAPGGRGYDMDIGELQIRMETLKAARRASRMWWFSLIAAIGAAFSAAASWYAIISNAN